MKNELLFGDCIKKMDVIPDNHVDGVITSPPYNFGHNPLHQAKDHKLNKLYKTFHDNMTNEEYLDFSLQVFRSYERVVKNSGVVCYVLGYNSKNASLPYQVVNHVENNTNFILADTIVWKKKFSYPLQTSSTHLSRICEFVFVFVHRDNKNSFVTNKEKGKINEKTGQQFYKHYTNIIEAKNNDGIRSSLNATFSVDLVKQIIEIYFPEESIILDNFMGIGTTPVACKHTNRKFIGIELEREYFDITKNRIDEKSKGKFWE